MAKWKFEGLRQLEKTFEKKIKDINKATDQGVQDAADYLLNISRPLVPVDTGRLKESGKTVKEKEMERLVTYEAHNPLNDYEYAPIQHENLDFKHAPGTQAKYLEQPFSENIDQMINIIGGEVAKGVEK